MTRRSTIEVGSLVWAFAGALLAAISLPEVNSDAQRYVALASIAFPLCAIAAAVTLRKGRDRVAGVLLLLSAATPTYMAYIINLPALLAGFTLLVAPAVALGAASE